MKKSFYLLLSFSIILLFSCEEEIILNDDNIQMRTKYPSIKSTQVDQVPPSICEAYIGGPQDGPASGCQTSYCPGVIHMTVSNLNCEEGDCYFVFRKNESNYPSGSSYTNYPCSYNNADVCFDSEGTYTFDVDLNGGVPVGDSPTHVYYLSGLLGSFPNNQNNSVTLTWTGAASGSQTITSGMSLPHNIIPTGACN